MVYYKYLNLDLGLHLSYGLRKGIAKQIYFVGRFAKVT